jgi:hypothetical protein
MLLSQNLSYLILYSYNYIINLFSFDYIVYWLNCISVILVGMFLIISLCIVPMSYYFYNNLCKNFISNCYYKNGCLIYTFFRFTCMPIIDAILHSSLYYKP